MSGNKNIKDIVISSIAVSRNPFDSKELSSMDITIDSVNKLLSMYEVKDVLQELKNYRSELENNLNYEPGSMTAADMMIGDKERLWNCRAAIRFIESGV